MEAIAKMKIWHRARRGWIIAGLAMAAWALVTAPYWVPLVF